MNKAKRQWGKMKPQLTKNRFFEVKHIHKYFNIFSYLNFNYQFPISIFILRKFLDAIKVFYK
jgi:hypothetical protein